MKTPQNNILIFRTSVAKKQDIKRIAGVLNSHPKVKQWSVDFDDWEKVLRIESTGMQPAEVMDALRSVNIMTAALT